MSVGDFKRKEKCPVRENCTGFLSYFLAKGDRANSIPALEPPSG
jgi:hypothetical protein